MTTQRKLAIHTSSYVRCPACGQGKYPVDHLLCGGVNMHAGPWYCDLCGQGFFLTVRDGLVVADLIDEVLVPIVAKLRLPPQEQAVRLRVRNRLPPDALDAETLRHLYEAHYCPVSILSKAVGVALGDDDDPHGLLEYMGFTEGDGR